MPSQTRIAKRTLKLPITQAGGLATAELTLPPDMSSITGLAITGRRRDLLWQRGEIGVSINGQDLIVDGEPASEYMYGSNHPSRTFAFGELPLNSSDRTVRIRYQDVEDNSTPFTAYDLKLVLTYVKR